MTTQLTGKNNYFEAFTVGRTIRHARGKTIESLESVLLSHLSMNSASAHFDEHAMRNTPFGQRVTFGGITAAVVIGLASQDTSENAIAELGMTGMRLKSPVVNGDTLYAFTEVLSATEENATAGVVVFRHLGVNQHDKLVFECERRVRIRRQPGAAS